MERHPGRERHDALSKKRNRGKTKCKRKGKSLYLPMGKVVKKGAHAKEGATKTFRRKKGLKGENTRFSKKRT